MNYTPSDACRTNKSHFLGSREPAFASPSRKQLLSSPWRRNSDDCRQSQRKNRLPYQPNSRVFPANQGRHDIEGCRRRRIPWHTDSKEFIFVALKRPNPAMPLQLAFSRAGRPKGVNDRTRWNSNNASFSSQPKISSQPLRVALIVQSLLGNFIVLEPMACPI